MTGTAPRPAAPAELVLQDELGHHDGAGDRRVHVADHQHRLGLLVLEDGLEAADDLGGLQGVRRRADVEREVGTRDVQVVEEDAGQLVVVVLAGMDQPRLPEGLAGEGAHERRDLDEVGPRPGDAQDLHRHDAASIAYFLAATEAI
jgi:hypothetical protein